MNVCRSRMLLMWYLFRIVDLPSDAALNILKRVRRGTPKPVQTPGEIRSLQKLEIVSASPIVEPGSP